MNNIDYEYIDVEIGGLVKLFNNAGIKTSFSCQGHNCGKISIRGCYKLAYIAFSKKVFDQNEDMFRDFYAIYWVEMDIVKRFSCNLDWRNTTDDIVWVYFSKEKYSLKRWENILKEFLSKYTIKEEIYK